MNYLFSFIIPVYNRPKEIEELLESATKVETINDCEIVIIEDGSDYTSKEVVKNFEDKLNISYFFKPNSGPGDSRNYGMKRAKADYFIILDSDVLLPSNYINEVKKNLDQNYVDCFGGPDRAHHSFSAVQKAINYAMTSFLTTGGIRGKEKQKKNFQPRSFNMGLSKKAFMASSGFSNIHPGEDPDLALRLNTMGFKTSLFSNCYVYHKRRINWESFAHQVYKFGLVRPILNSWHPKSKSLAFYFPTLFSIGFLLALFLIFFNFIWLALFYILYFVFVLTDAFRVEKSLRISFLAIYAVLIQFFFYGTAFLRSSINISLFGKDPKIVYPFLFFKHKT